MRLCLLLQLKLMKNQDLNNWKVCDPDNAEDQLPMPYRLIDEVLQQTILYQLNLALHRIEQKKKDNNYEGEIKQYIAQTTMDVQNLSCLSSRTKTHNHLLAGDKNGNVYLLDPAKKSIFSKKEIQSQKRVIKISEALITDGQTMITTLAVIQNAHPVITILRYKHSQPKLFLTHEVVVSQDPQNINKMPFDCQLQDSGRILVAKTYQGAILGFSIPQVSLDIDSHIKTGSIAMAQEQVKKVLKYPLKMAIFNTEVVKIKDRILQIKFEGVKVQPKYSQLLDKLKKTKKEAPPEPQPAKKDAKKKDDKKPPEQPQEQKMEQSQVIYNPVLQKKQQLIQNSLDNTEAYELPKYKPYVYFINGTYMLPKNRYFQKGTSVEIPAKILYGWTNTKQFFIGEISGKNNLSVIPEYLYVAYFQQKLPEQLRAEQKINKSKVLVTKNVQKLMNLSPVCCVDLSTPDELFLACGLSDGTVAIWNIKTCVSEMVTDKHELAVTCIKIFDGWKVISGSEKGSIHIDNLLENKNEVKRTNVFESKNAIPITDLQVNELGLALALDREGNLRVYDLWRNEKISKVYSCNSFALIEGRGKRWLSSLNIKPSHSLYTNRDFTVILSTNWPNVPSRIEDASEQEINRLKLYDQNPWCCRGTNVHVIRNFQFLLSLFEGLESTYKKGYQRKKIQNLFSNLQFTQLYDRNFDIPDFGRTTAVKRGFNAKQVETNKSGFSSANSEARKTSRTNKSKSKGKLHPEPSTSKLTKQVLHPEKFLLERRVIQKRDIVTDESLTALLRAQHQKKQRRQILLHNDISKIGL